jgi:hypothetical protein
MGQEQYAAYEAEKGADEATLGDIDEVEEVIVLEGPESVPDVPDTPESVPEDVPAAPDVPVETPDEGVPFEDESDSDGLGEPEGTDGEEPF